MVKLILTLITDYVLKIKLACILLFPPSYSWWISGWLFRRCWVWMPQPWPFQIMKLSNYLRPVFIVIITITTFIMLICPGNVLLTTGLISTTSRTFLTAPLWSLLPPGLIQMILAFMKLRFIYYTYAKLHLKM